LIKNRFTGNSIRGSATTITIDRQTNSIKQVHLCVALFIRSAAVCFGFVCKFAVRFVGLITIKHPTFMAMRWEAIARSLMPQSCITHMSITLASIQSMFLFQFNALCPIKRKSDTLICYIITTKLLSTSICEKVLNIIKQLDNTSKLLHTILPGQTKNLKRIKFEQIFIDEGLF
jgi:hypothetical protein